MRAVSSGEKGVLQDGGGPVRLASVLDAYKRLFCEARRCFGDRVRGQPQWESVRCGTQR